MSLFLPEDPQQQPTGVTQFTPGSPATTQNDVALMQRVFSAAAQNPLMLPPDFMAYIFDYIQTSRLQVPIGQVFGFDQRAAQRAAVDAQETTTSSTDTDLATVGPSLTVSPGIYLVLVTAYMRNDTAGVPAIMIPDTGIDDSGAAITANDQLGTHIGVSTVTLAAPTTVTAKYRSDGTATARFQYRNLIMMKTA